MEAFAKEGSRVLLKHLINPSGMASVPKYVCTHCAMYGKAWGGRYRHCTLLSRSLQDQSDVWQPTVAFIWSIMTPTSGRGEGGGGWRRWAQEAQVRRSKIRVKKNCKIRKGLESGKEGVSQLPVRVQSQPPQGLCLICSNQWSPQSSNKWWKSHRQLFRSNWGSSMCCTNSYCWMTDCCITTPSEAFVVSTKEECVVTLWPIASTCFCWNHRWLFHLGWIHKQPFTRH